MKVFISWSGESSEIAALALREWLPCIFQSLTPFVSSEDLRKGSRWQIRLSEELQVSSFGIICLTSQNLSAPWLLFEAGALSKALKEAHVCTLLLGDLEPTDVTGPLATFQHTRYGKPEMWKLVESVNAALALAGNKLDNSLLEKTFERFWPDLEVGMAKSLIVGQGGNPNARRTDRDLLEEILTLLRQPADAQDSLNVIGKMRQLLALDLRNFGLQKTLVKALQAEDIWNLGSLATREARVVETIPGVDSSDYAALKKLLEKVGLSFGMQINEDLWSPG